MHLSSLSSWTTSPHRRVVTLVIGACLLAGCGAAGPSTSAAPNVAPPSTSVPSIATPGTPAPSIASGGVGALNTASGGAGVPGATLGGAAVPSTNALFPGSATTAGRLPRLSGPQRRGANPPSGLGFTYASPGWVTSFRGQASGVTARVVVWLPPEYGLPAYAHQTFPVVQLLGGYPANVFGWMHGLDVVSAYYRARAAGMTPAVLVATEINVGGRADLECLDAPGHPPVETWITRDVPAFIESHFRVARPGGWGVMGFSMGGFCAPYLALTHPEVYRAAVAINGYFVASSPQLPKAFLDRHSVLLAATSRPAVSILWTTTHHDPSSPMSWGYQLQQAVSAPTQVAVDIVHGAGHATMQWSPSVSTHLQWLVARLPSA